LFQRGVQRLGNVIQRTVRTANADQMNMRDPVLKYQFAIAGKAIRNQRQALIAFGVGRAFEEFIQHAGEDIRGCQDITRDAGLIGRLAIQQVVPVRIVNRHL
jgi:hypothetical protein